MADEDTKGNMAEEVKEEAKEESKEEKKEEEDVVKTKEVKEDDEEFEEVKVEEEKVDEEEDEQMEDEEEEEKEETNNVQDKIKEEKQKENDKVEDEEEKEEDEDEEEKKKESPKKRKKKTVPAEVSTPVKDPGVPLYDQPLETSGKRDRKKVERFVQEAKKEPENVSGNGVPLGDIAFIEAQIALHTGLFYKRARRCEATVVPADPNISDDESLDDDDVDDPDFMLPEPHDINTPHTSDEPNPKRKCVRPTVEEIPEEEESDEDEEEAMEVALEEGARANAKGKGKGKGKKSQARPTTWKKEDIKNIPLPAYQHNPPQYIEAPHQYFARFFTPQVLKHITYQTNLYATQKDIASNFATTEDEMMVFISILLYMGIVECPSLDDYWAMYTRVPQVADLMSSKRFRLLRRTIHFNDNSQLGGTIDRFYKVRPLFTFITEAFRNQPQSPKQSIDEVMVGYKGKTAGNLRQYIKNKPDKWGFKLFSRASEDGFIHDMVLYQGKTTLPAHGIPLSPEQDILGATSQIVSVLASTITSSSTTAIFADNFFTSLELVRYLQAKNIRYTGTARDNRIGNPPLMSVKEMEKKAVPRGTYDYLTTDDGILALRWKDNKPVTVLSTDLGLEPVSTCKRYCKDTKRKADVDCPNVIKSYNANMGGIDKSDMLVHLYRTPMKSKRWYMRLFAYCLDLCMTNAWLYYRRDCRSLGEKGICLKDFRIQVFRCTSTKKSSIPRPLRSSLSPGSPNTSSPNNAINLPIAVRGQRSQVPDASVRFDRTLFHVPLYVARQTCKHCSRKGAIIRSNLLCQVCRVHLCLNGERNCFKDYHTPVA